MDITNEQIIQEFKRQVRLCGGIGKAEMLKIINEHFQNPKEPEAVHGNEAEKGVCEHLQIIDLGDGVSQCRKCYELFDDD